MQSFDKLWHLKYEHVSKQYTTHLDDVILVKKHIGDSPGT
ncbi:DUF4113 domain-containing protein [Bacteroides ilei]